MPPMKLIRTLAFVATMTASLSLAQNPAAPNSADALWVKVETSIAEMKNPTQPTETQEQAKEFYWKSFKAFDDALEQFIKAHPSDVRRWDGKLFGASTATLRNRLAYPVKYDLNAGLAEIAGASDAEPATKSHASGLLMLEQMKDVEAGRLAPGEWIKRVEAHLEAHPDSSVNMLLAEKKRILPLITELKSKPLELKFKAIDGRDVDLAKMRGKVVLIDFWATWCAPCIEELPSLMRLYSEKKDQGFEIIGISMDDDLGRLAYFMKESGIPWPQYADPKGVQNDIVTRLGVQITPTLWLVGKDGYLITDNALNGTVEAVETALKK